MSMIKIKNPDSMGKVYEDFIRSVETSKNIKPGGALITFPDKDRNICELSATYIVKPGRFAKEQRVVVVMTFHKDENGDYVSNIEESIFHIVQEDNGDLRETWKGKLKDAESVDKLKEIVKIHKDAALNLPSKA
ncbi:MAG: hypothetical protein QXI73_05670 [Thermoproteota archaeon]